LLICYIDAISGGGSNIKVLDNLRLQKNSSGVVEKRADSCCTFPPKPNLGDVCKIEDCVGLTCDFNPYQCYTTLYLNAVCTIFTDSHGDKWSRKADCNQGIIYDYDTPNCTGEYLIVCGECIYCFGVPTLQGFFNIYILSS